MDLARSLSDRLARIASPTSGTVSKQLYFAALLVGFSALVSISRPELVLTAQYLAALGVLALATVLAVAGHDVVVTGVGMKERVPDRHDGWC